MKGKSQIKLFLFKINHKHLTISLLKMCVFNKNVLIIGIKVAKKLKIL